MDRDALGHVRSPWWSDQLVEPVPSLTDRRRRRRCGGLRAEVEADDRPEDADQHRQDVLAHLEALADLLLAAGAEEDREHDHERYAHGRHGEQEGDQPARLAGLGQFHEHRLVQREAEQEEDDAAAEQDGPEVDVAHPAGDGGPEALGPGRRREPAIGAFQARQRLPFVGDGGAAGDGGGIGGPAVAAGRPCLTEARPQLPHVRDTGVSRRLGVQPSVEAAHAHRSRSWRRARARGRACPSGRRWRPDRASRSRIARNSTPPGRWGTGSPCRGGLGACAPAFAVLIRLIVFFALGRNLRARRDHVAPNGAFKRTTARLRMATKVTQAR